MTLILALTHLRCRVFVHRLGNNHNQKSLASHKHTTGEQKGSSTKAPTIDYDRRYIRTLSGGKFFALEPEHGDIRIEDIAQGLANSCRWGGQCKFWYPVAAHAIWVSLVLPKPLKLCGLLHDASEGMGLADIASPFKAFLPDYKKIEDTAMGGIARKFGFEWPVPPEVKKADMLALYHERKALFDVHPSLDKATIPMMGLPKGWRLPTWNYQNWTPAKARDTFMHYFQVYTR